MKQDWADETEDRMVDPRAQGEDFDLLERTEVVTYGDKRQVTHKVYYRLVEVMEREYCGVVSRRDWVPFGRASNASPSHDLPEKVEFSLTDPDDLGSSGVITHAEKIVQKDLAELERAIKFELVRSSHKERSVVQLTSADANEDSAMDSGAKPGVFKARTDATSSRPTNNAEVCSLRIDNLSSETTEEALRVLCNRMGNVSKLYIPMNKDGAKKCKGFAFVTFNRQSDAEAAKAKLHRLPFLHSVLSVSWGTKTNVPGGERPMRK